MDGKGNPMYIQNQLSQSPVVKAMTPSTWERHDSQAAGDQPSRGRPEDYDDDVPKRVAGAEDVLFEMKNCNPAAIP